MTPCCRKVQRQSNTGFTLIEMLIVVGVIAILAMLVVPALDAALEAARASAARTALLDSVTLAVRRSSMAGVHVVICPGNADSGCRNSIDWSGGWIVFSDLDADRKRQSGEPVLHQQPRLSGKVHLRSTIGRTKLVFQANGGNAGSNVTFTLCDGRGASQATTLIIANDGRLRGARASAATALACLSPT